jgi:hypothetical protein
MQMNSTAEPGVMRTAAARLAIHRTILNRRMVNIDGVRLSPSKGERIKLRGLATIVAKSTRPSPYRLPWEGRGGKNCATYLPKRDSNSR